jgi:hypothetical protein
MDNQGAITKWKARLVARGDMSPPSEEEIYASTLAYRTFRTMVALIAYVDLETTQLDIVTAYLNADLNLKKPVHVAIPSRHISTQGTC